MKYFLIISIAFLVGCGKFGLYSGDNSRVIASVGDVELRESALEGVYVSAITSADSGALAQEFISSWILGEVKRQAAEKQIDDNDDKVNQIERMVALYRAQLLTYKFEQEYLEQHIDTTITDAQIGDYYKSHPDNFRLAGPLVKAIVVRIPSGLRQSKRLEEMFSSDRGGSLDDFINICQKNDYRVDDFREGWVDFSTVLQHIPFGKVNFDEFLRNRKSYDVTDDQYKYMMRVESYLPTGALSPLERERGSITKILHNMRRGELLRALDDSLLGAAKGQNLIHIEQ